MPDSQLAQLSDYERRAWHASLTRLNEPPHKTLVPKRVREVASSTVGRTSEFADAHLPMATVKSVVEKAMDGTLELTFNPALKSASVDGALDGYRKKHSNVQTVEDLMSLDLRHLDGFRRRKGLYVAASATQGARGVHADPASLSAMRIDLAP